MRRSRRAIFRPLFASSGRFLPTPEKKEEIEQADEANDCQKSNSAGSSFRYE
jgi:hypothetical protein